MARSRSIGAEIRLGRLPAGRIPNIQPGHIAEALQYREQLQVALPDFV